MLLDYNRWCWCQLHWFIFTRREPVVSYYYLSDNDILRSGDAISIYDAEGNLITAWNGTLVNAYPYIVLRQPAIQVIFTTATISTTSTFGAAFYSGKCGKNVELRDMNAIFDDGSYDALYAANSRCNWIIRPVSDNGLPIRYIQLRFIRADLRDTDFVRVYNPSGR